MAVLGNGFSTPMIKYPILSELGLLTQGNILQFVKQYESIAKDSFLMKTAATPGGAKYTPQMVFKQYIDSNKPVPSFKVTANASNATAGNAITVTLTSASHEGGGKYSPLSIGQLWRNENDGVEWEVRSVNKSSNGAHTASIAPALSTVVPSVTASNAHFSYLGRISAKEASSQMDGIYRTFETRERDLQIIRTNASYSDLSKFELIMEGDQSYYDIDKTNLDFDHMYSEEQALVFGNIKDNLTESAGNKNTNAEGMLQQIIRYGTYLPTATLNNAFFQDMKRVNDADGFTNKFEILCDTEFEILYQDFLTAQSGANNIKVEITPENKEIQAVFDYSDTIKYYGIEMTLKNYPFFNPSRYSGADTNTGFNKRTAVFLPVGNVNVKDTQTGGNVVVPHYRVRYMSDKDGGVMNFFNTSGALINPTGSTERKIDIALTSYKGLEMYNMPSFKVVRF